MIFGIGLPKTGTTSLTKAMSILGYKSAHFLTNQEYIELPKFDFVSDLPIPARYKHYDKVFKQSKFIYTIRDMDSWLLSCEIHWKNRPKLANNKRKEMFGISHFDKDIFKMTYTKHDEDIKDYFKNRSNDLLIFNVKDGWMPLCDFLDKDIPKVNFPHINKKPR